MRKIALISIIMVAILLNACLPAFAGAGVYYAVQSGDTLYGIGKKFGLRYRSIMSSNNLKSTHIVPGLKISIPVDESNIYTVKQGDTLFGISRKYGVNVADIKRASKLTTSVIWPEMKLVVPVVRKTDMVTPVFSGKSLFNRNDIYLLAKLIHAEARGESLEGQIAVGAVIMNRLTSEGFPSNVRQIIFQKTKGVYQFTPVQDGQINLEPNRTAYYAAERAIKGDDPTGDALFFYNPETSSDQWIRTLKVTRVIGNHVFAK